MNAVDAIKSVTRTPSWYLGDESDFDRAKALRVGDLTMMMESLTARTLEFGMLAQFDPQGSFFAGEIERARALGGKEVRSVVEHVLDEDRTLKVIVKPKKGAALSVRVAEGFAPSDKPVPEELPVDRTEAARVLDVPSEIGPLAQARHFELPNGLRVVLLTTEQPMPVVTARMVYAVGKAQEPAGKAGLAEIAAGDVRAPSSKTLLRGHRTPSMRTESTSTSTSATTSRSSRCAGSPSTRTSSSKAWVACSRRPM